MVPKVSLGLEDFASLIGNQFSHGNALLMRSEGMEKSDGQFGAKSEPFGLDGANPNHGLIQQSADNPAMDGLFESSVLIPRNKDRLNNAVIRLETQIKADGIQLPANKTRASVRQALHEIQ